MNLVTVDDATDNPWLNSTAPFSARQQEVMWLGATHRVMEGDWLWTDGSSITFVAWDSGEPNNLNGVEHCLGMIINSGFVWNDQPCDFTRPFIRESGP